MNQIQSTQQYQVKINQQAFSCHDSISQKSQGRREVTDSKKQQPILNCNKKALSSSTQSIKCGMSSIFKRQLLRMIFIPLLIVLILLTIALTFKQNNYQTNDYFYSKNIQINRKIRGIVPPLNQTKQNIFGEYQIGLVQSFSVENRRMLEGFKVEMWRNESMRISEIGKENKCWGLYRLKFYSSTIFIQKISSQLSKVSASKNTQSNYTKKALENEQKQSNGTVNKTTPLNSSNSSSSTTTEDNTTRTVNNSSNSNTLTHQTSNSQAETSQVAKTVQTAQPICQLDKWSKLNQILANSHIWTFADGNFYLMEFSQLGDDGNGVLIMRMTNPYLSTL